MLQNSAGENFLLMIMDAEFGSNFAALIQAQLIMSLPDSKMQIRNKLVANSKHCSPHLHVATSCKYLWRMHKRLKEITVRMEC